MIVGELKINKLLLQGHGATSSDFSFVVHDDSLHMKMGNISLLTVAPDSDNTSLESTESKHHIEISKQIEFHENIVVHKQLKLPKASRQKMLNDYITSRPQMDHMMHMIGGSGLNSALEFCQKMIPHHQEAIDTGKVIYNWASDTMVSDFGLHLQIGQGIEIENMQNIGMSLAEKLGKLDQIIVLDEQIFNPKTNNVENKKQLKTWEGYTRMMNNEHHVLEFPGPNMKYPMMELTFLQDMLTHHEGGQMMIESFLQSVGSSADGLLNKALDLENIIDSEIDVTMRYLTSADPTKLENKLFKIINKMYKAHLSEIVWLKESIDILCYRNEISSKVDSGNSNGSENTFVVTSGMASGAHKFLLNGEYKAMVMLSVGKEYTFDQSDTSNCGPIGLSTIEDGRMNGTLHENHDYIDGIQYFMDGNEVTKDHYKNMFTMHTERYVMFETNASTPMFLYYYCKKMANMGGTLHIM